MADSNTDLIDALTATMPDYAYKTGYLSSMLTILATRYPCVREYVEEHLADRRGDDV